MGSPAASSSGTVLRLQQPIAGPKWHQTTHHRCDLTTGGDPIGVKFKRFITIFPLIIRDLEHAPWKYGHVSRLFNGSDVGEGMLHPIGGVGGPCSLP